MTWDSSRAAEHTKRIYERGTLDWQPIEPVLEEAKALIAPGKALRKYEARKARSDAERTTDVRKAELTEGEKIASGQKTIVRDALNSLRGSNRIETKIVDGVEYFRRIAPVAPGEACPHCGVVDPRTPAAMKQPRSPAKESVPLATVIELESWRQRSQDSLPGLAPWRPNTSSS